MRLSKTEGEKNLISLIINAVQFLTCPDNRNLKLIDDTLYCCALFIYLFPPFKFSLLFFSVLSSQWFTTLCLIEGNTFTLPWMYVTRTPPPSKLPYCFTPRPLFCYPLCSYIHLSSPYSSFSSPAISRVYLSLVLFSAVSIFHIRVKS